MNVPDDSRSAFAVVMQARKDLTCKLMEAEDPSVRAARRACRQFIDGAGRYGATYVANPEALATALATVRAALAGLQ